MVTLGLSNTGGEKEGPPALPVVDGSNDPHVSLPSKSFPGNDISDEELAELRKRWGALGRPADGLILPPMSESASSAFGVWSPPTRVGGPRLNTCASLDLSRAC